VKNSRPRCGLAHERANFFVECPAPLFSSPTPDAFVWSHHLRHSTAISPRAKPAHDALPTSADASVRLMRESESAPAGSAGRALLFATETRGTAKPRLAPLNFVLVKTFLVVPQ
jgi:hypothetical protein